MIDRLAASDPDRHRRPGTTDGLIAVWERVYSPERLLHRHAYVQVVLPERGRMELVVEGRSGYVGGVQLAVVAPEVEHLSWAEPAASCLVVDLPVGLFDDVPLPPDRPFRPLDARLTALGQVLRAELRAGGLVDRLVADSLGRYAARAFILRSDDRAHRTPISTGNRRLARRVQELLDVRFADDLTLTEIAAALGVSVAHLQRAFKADTGQTIVGYVQRRRLALAADLLRTTELTITEVGLACGVANPSYFTRLFAREVGCTPSRFRADIWRSSRSCENSQAS